MMTQSQPQTKTPLFRTSLRDWQAGWKARQAAAQTEAPPTEQPVAVAADSAPRVKKFIAYKRRKLKQQSMQQH